MPYFYEKIDMIVTSGSTDDVILSTAVARKLHCGIVTSSNLYVRENDKIIICFSKFNEKTYKQIKEKIKKYDGVLIDCISVQCTKDEKQNYCKHCVVSL